MPRPEARYSRLPNMPHPDVRYSRLLNMPRKKKKFPLLIMSSENNITKFKFHEIVRASLPELIKA